MHDTPVSREAVISALERLDRAADQLARVIIGHDWGVDGPPREVWGVANTLIDARGYLRAAMRFSGGPVLRVLIPAPTMGDGPVRAEADGDR